MGTENVVSLEDSRRDLEHNREVYRRYQTMLMEAEDYYSENTRKIDPLTERKLGLCDWYRKKHPKTDKNDEEIMEHINYLMEKYEDE